MGVYLYTEKKHRDKQYYKVLQLLENKEEQIIVIGDLNMIKAHQEKLKKAGDQNQQLRFKILMTSSTNESWWIWVMRETYLLGQIVNLEAILQRNDLIEHW
ncbi:hypothetical protein AAHE18_02G146800 [Arachis hypogaea]